jgi:predicted deacetylase
MRSPEKLIEIFNNYDKENNFEKFVDQLSFEEITQMLMVGELLQEMYPQKKYSNFLEYMKNKRKTFLEKN